MYQLHKFANYIRDVQLDYMQTVFADLLRRALHSVNPVMGDGSRLASDLYCALCPSTGVHEGAALRCECWCHAARAALEAARAGGGGAEAGGGTRRLSPPRPAAR